MQYASSFQKLFYQKKTVEEIRALLRSEGYQPVKVSNSPGYEYVPHQHPETKILAILKGHMIVLLNGTTFTASKKDRVVIAGNDVHAVTVGPKGCEFFWATFRSRAQS